MGKINRLRIRRFKRLEEITFDPQLATVFVGGNNSGKSSILQALHFAVAVAQSASLVSSEGWNDEVYSSIFRPEQLIYTPSAELQSLGFNGTIREQPETWIEVEISEGENRNCQIAIGRDLRGNVTVRMEGKDLGREIQDISRPYSIYAPGLAGIARQETVDFYMVYYAPADHSEIKRDLYTANVVFVFKTQVSNELIPINPLGMTITYFREDQAFK